MSEPGNQWLTRKEAAEHLRKMGLLVVPRTLARLSKKGMGPPYTRYLHRLVSYNKTDLENWAKQQVVERGSMKREKPKPQGALGVSLGRGQ